MCKTIPSPPLQMSSISQNICPCKTLPSKSKIAPQIEVRQPNMKNWSACFAASCNKCNHSTQKPQEVVQVAKVVAQPVTQPAAQPVVEQVKVTEVVVETPDVKETVAESSINNNNVVTVENFAPIVRKNPPLQYFVPATSEMPTFISPMKPVTSSTVRCNLNGFSTFDPSVPVVYPPELCPIVFNNVIHPTTTGFTIDRKSTRLNSSHR